MNNKYLLDQKLIVAIVKKDYAVDLIKIAKKHGAEGSTIFYGKGTAEKDVYENLLGVKYEPEKEVVLIGVENEIVDDVLKVISKKAKMNKPGNGIAFVLDVSKCIGIARLLKEMGI